MTCTRNGNTLKVLEWDRFGIVSPVTDLKGGKSSVNKENTEANMLDRNIPVGTIAYERKVRSMSYTKVSEYLWRANYTQKNFITNKDTVWENEYYTFKFPVRKKKRHHRGRHGNSG